MSRLTARPRTSSLLWALTPLGGFLSRLDVPANDVTNDDERWAERDLFVS